MTTAKPDILVVEDDSDLAEVVVLALEAAGHATRWARNGKEALSAVEELAPRVILLDMMMPVMNGWEFAEAFWARYRGNAHRPRLIVTTAAESAKARAREVEADSVLRKPFDLDALTEAVARTTEGGDRA